ncbi:hypothetical protein [uncultured Salinicola sp.]|uniref:hypothetical protein n=1 Tax=uncultured Salinicola sp. TaxID=1193542 RepID=UPI00260AC7D1|nr:hypothetical protein [uncultured Salinicola sp.]
MRQTVAMGMQRASMRDPLLDAGMAELLKWIETNTGTTARRMHELCGRVEKYDSTVFKCQWPSPKRSVEVHYRKIASRTVILAANYDGEGYSFGRGGILIRKEMVPEALRLKLTDRDVVMKASDIIDHPYLIGAWTSRAEEKDGKVSIALNRGAPRHVLTAAGVESVA